jgi:hypothetical protein
MASTAIAAAALLTWLGWVAWQLDHRRPAHLDDYDDAPIDENDVGRAKDLPLDMGESSKEW